MLVFISRSAPNQNNFIHRSTSFQEDNAVTGAQRADLSYS